RAPGQLRRGAADGHRGTRVLGRDGPPGRRRGAPAHRGAHNDAYWALTTNRHVLDRLALALLERETLNQKEIAEIFTDLVKIDKRVVWLSNDERPVHPEGPVLSPKERAAQSTD